MPVNPKKLLADVLDAGRAIQRHCGGKTRDDYLADEVLRGFVERKLLVIGEASSPSVTALFTATMP